MSAGRPHGEVRLAMRAAMEGAPGLLALQIAQRACVGVTVARRTLDNMVRAGEVEIAATRGTGRGRPPALYRLVPELGAGTEPTPLQQQRAAMADA